MYELINRNAGLIVESVGNAFITEYDWLMDQLSQRNVATDEEYQRRYKNFWAMNAARLSPDFYDTYFRLLQNANTRGRVDLIQVCHDLYEVPSHDRRHTLQFSFATKLVHMVLRQRPIYDSLVRDFYYLPDA